MMGPGDIDGPISASMVETPTRAITQPLARKAKSLIGRRVSSQTSANRSEPTKKYAPQPNRRNSASATYAPDRPQALASLWVAETVEFGMGTNVECGAVKNGCGAGLDGAGARSLGW